MVHNLVKNLWLKANLYTILGYIIEIEGGIAMMNGSMAMMSLGMWIWILFLIALAAAGIYVIVRLAVKSQNSSHDPSLSTLRQRFASGELTEEEFEQKKRVLQNK
jgi:putative membrane protein